MSPFPFRREVSRLPQYIACTWHLTSIFLGTSAVGTRNGHVLICVLFCQYSRIILPPNATTTEKRLLSILFVCEDNRTVGGKFCPRKEDEKVVFPTCDGCLTKSFAPSCEGSLGSSYAKMEREAKGQKSGRAKYRFSSSPWQWKAVPRSAVSFVAG